jgi:hypothetical protein
VCGLPFTADRHAIDLCPDCERIERLQFEPRPDLPYTPPKYSKAWNQERLGVVGNRDE